MVRKEETLWEEKVIEEVLLGFVLSGKEFFFWYYSKIRIFFFLNLSNADVENCESFKSFGYIYRLVANPCDAPDSYQMFNI